MANKISRRDFICGSAATLAGSMLFNRLPVLASEDDLYDSIVIGIKVEVDSLNPDDYNAGCKPYVCSEIYEPLFDINGLGGEMYPVLAKGYTVVDALHYQVELYDYITDSDGNNITANDVVFCYQHIAEAGTNTTLTSYMENVEAIDDYIVEFTWTTAPEPVGDLEAMFAKVWIYSQAAFEASSDSFATAPVATGPYVVTDFTAGASVTIVANENYWQTDESVLYQQHKANVKTIRFDTIMESSQLAVALQTNAVDYVDAIAYEYVSYFSEGGQFSEGHNVDMYRDSMMYLLTPNCSENSQLQDENLRKALFYAIDTEQLCAAIIGDSEPAVTFCNENYPEYSESFAEQENYITTYDPDLAKEYLNQSTYDGSSLKMLLTNSETFQNAGQILQVLWQNNLGITVEFLTYDSATVKEYKELDDMWDICFESRGSTDYAITYLKGMFDTDLKHAANWVEDDTLQELVVTLESIEGHTSENYEALHNYLVELAYEMPLFYIFSYSIYSDAITSICRTAKDIILPGGCTYAS